MKKHLLILFLFCFELLSKEFTVASYNVENLFDLTYNKSEYKEYVPNTSANWNKTTYTTKLKHTVQAIQAINADIIALQEIESQEAFDALKNKLNIYTYGSFLKNKRASIGLGVLSKYPIIENKKIKVLHSKVNRPIQAATIQIEDKTFILFNNHWPSKRRAENERVRYAFALKDAIKSFDANEDYILIGDFNSNYNELHTIKREKRLNTTHGMTGINHVLNTTIKQQFVKKSQIFSYKNLVHYNLWLEYPYLERFSNKYRGIKNTPDNILLSPALFDKQNISYVHNSFDVIKPEFLYQKGIIKRWKMHKRKHVGIGYSDHLPIVATFSTLKQKKVPLKNASKIAQLYDSKEFKKARVNATVIYKNNRHAIIKAPNDRAIYLYNCAKDLQLGFTYTLSVLQTKEHYGLKEVSQIRILKELGYNKKYKSLLTSFEKIDLFNPLFQNEIITNLQGTYNKGYVHFNNTKIKLYSKDKNLLPKNGQNITIIRAHLGYFKHKAQLIIYKKSDIKVNL